MCVAGAGWYTQTEMSMKENGQKTWQMVLAATTT